MSEADILERRLRELYDEIDPVPEHVLEAAIGAFAWRTVDADLAELAADSELTASSARGDHSGRLMTFEGSDLSIEIEVAHTGGARRIVGQLVPPEAAHLRVETPTGAVTADADALGRFVIPDVPPGIVRLTISGRDGRADVTTRWATI